jgi:hypothetical protein
MAFISSTQGGMCQGPADTCKVPASPSPIPTPFVNLAFCNQANPSSTSTKVTITCQPVLHQQSTITMSSGDEAGSAGGVVSGMIKGQVSYVNGSVKVLAEGKPVVWQGSSTLHNGSSANTSGSQSSPSQTKVLSNA